MKKNVGGGRVEHQKFGLFFVAVFFVLTMAFLISFSKPLVIPLPTLAFRLTNTHNTQPDQNAKVSRPPIIILDVQAQKEDRQQKKALCDFSDSRSDICDIEGDIRIHGNSCSISFIGEESSWLIKPYARKFDPTAMAHVSLMSIKSQAELAPPRCTVNHSVPAIVFSTGGYTGNIFHDFTDVLIPLFLTSHQFHGEVQFLVSEKHTWWLNKYTPYFKELSRFDVLDFNKEGKIHCYPRVIVGLTSHKEMSIDPSRSPNGYSMVDFARSMRRSYSLERGTAIKLGANQSKNKPRLLLVARKRTRSFKNVDEIVTLAQGLGYEVVVAEPHITNLVEYSRIVNSCDVMMGVHGAGLTNLVFLPIGATVIQVVPFGGLEKMCWTDFGVPSLDMGLNYLQYNISEEESTLRDIYPRDDPVFKDPSSIHEQGWSVLSEIYLTKQSVRLDVGKFKGYLVKALEFLHQ